MTAQQEKTCPTGPLEHTKPAARALWPLLLFLALFFGAGLFFTLGGDAMGFYVLRAPVAILPAIALAIWLGRKGRRPATEVLLEGMGQRDVLLMCLIFLLAGGFAQISRQVGGVDAMVFLGLSVLPASLLLPGLFAIAALISLAMGTSVGTIAAVGPVATGLAAAAGLDLPLAMGAIVGGAMFGDNLSVISDTTIAATRSQGASMRDKFRENIWIAAPAALLTLLVLALISNEPESVAAPAARVWMAVPYLLVLVLAVVGMNVLGVLALGIVLAGGMGIFLQPDYGFASLAGDLWSGMESMTEILLLALLVGGLAALMREQGGLDWLVRLISRLSGRRSGRRVGEAGISALGAAADVFTANNTVAILMCGPVARELAQQHGISPARSASLLDVFSCVLQGVLPYGAQILLAASLAELTPLAIAGRVHYCWLLALAALLAIAFDWPRRQRGQPVEAKTR